MASRDPDDDIVLWVLRRVVDLVPDYAASRSNVVLEVEQRARLTWGGRRVYIPKHSPAPPPTAHAGRDRQRG